MNRTAWLAASVLILAPGTVLAQMGGMGGGMMGGGMGMGGMGMGGMGMSSYARWPEIRRSVQVEMEGGRKIEGKVAMRFLMVRGDLGSYAIEAGKLRTVRFLKPATVEEPDNQPPQPGGGGVNRRRGGGMMAANGNNPQNPPGPRAKVVLESGEDVIGEVAFMGQGFRLSVGYGFIILDASKLRSMTFGPVVKEPAPADRGESKPGAKEARSIDSAPPDYTRNGPNLVIRSRSGDRTILYNIDRKQSIELAGPKDGPISIQPLWREGNLLALSIEGARVSRIAAADTTGWHVQELREPAADGATPIVGPGIAVYHLGRYVYAFSSSAHRWDVAELPEGLDATPMIEPNRATIEVDGHIFLFGDSGRWEHVDVREILGEAGAEDRSGKR